MRGRSEAVARALASVVAGALLLCHPQLREGAAGARARLDREREQLAALSRLQSRIDGRQGAALEQLVEVHGLFGDTELRWQHRDGCAFLTFGACPDVAGREVLAAEVGR